MDSLWTHWHGHPDVLVGLAALEVAYLIGVGPLRERYNLAEAADPRQVATFTTGVIVIFLALLIFLPMMGALLNGFMQTIADRIVAG